MQEVDWFWYLTGVATFPALVGMATIVWIAIQAVRTTSNAQKN